MTDNSREGGEPKMMEAKFEIVQYGDEEIQEVRLNGAYLMTLSHDEDGWDGMSRVCDIVCRIAKAMGGTVESVDALDENGEVMWQPA